MALSNEYVYVNFVKQEHSIEQSKKVIDNAKNNISRFDEKEASYFSTDYYKQKMQEFNNVASDASDHIVDLIIVFIFQTMLFPIIFLWALYKVVVSFLGSFHIP